MIDLHNFIIDLHQPYMVDGLFFAWKLLSEVGMPSSATRTFTDPDRYFAGIRNLQIDGVITKRGEFRAESTRIDLHRLWMHRFDESLPRIMRITPSGKRSLILFATDPYQPKMQVSGIETSQDQIPVFGLDGHTTLDTRPGRGTKPTISKYFPSLPAASDVGLCFSDDCRAEG
jgi:hypothetical protein